MGRNSQVTLTLHAEAKKEKGQSICHISFSIFHLSAFVRTRPFLELKKMKNGKWKTGNGQMIRVLGAFVTGRLECAPRELPIPLASSQR